MTREEAADLLDNLIGMVEDNQENDYDEALKMAIEALNVTDINVGDIISREDALLPSVQPTQNERVNSNNALDTISRQAAIDRINKQREHLEPNIFPQDKIGDAAYRICAEFIERLPFAQPEIIRCKDCKYFELDHFEKVDEFPIPIIVAHEICMKWSGGCRTSIDGWCFMAERRTDETD